MNPPNEPILANHAEWTQVILLWAERTQRDKRLPKNARAFALLEFEDEQG